MLQGNFKGVSWVFEDNVKFASSKFKKFKVLWMFQEYFNEVLFCNFVAEEGGLVNFQFDWGYFLFIFFKNQPINHYFFSSFFSKILDISTFRVGSTIYH